MLGADWEGDDQTQNFIEQGIWQNGYTNKFLDTVKSVEVGDKVAIKTVYVQKNNLPFENYGCDVSCMKIKVIGEVIDNVGDGRTLKVKWEPLAQEKIIYLYTYWHTIMRIARPFVKAWIFDDAPQNYLELEQIYKKRAGLGEDALSDEQILNHFKAVDGYLEVIQNEAHKSLFLSLVRFMHRLPLDWWITLNDTKHQIRFGENKSFKGLHSTNRILGFLDFKLEGLFLTSNQDDFFSAQERIQLTPELFEELKKGDFIAVDKERDPYVGYLPNDYVDKNMNENQKKSILQTPQNLNRILFGAAGTGKTYNTINHALSILDNKTLEELDNKDRIQLKADFDRYVEQGRIKFVTFHQSFSYEDFVEGIRAETDGDGKLRYEVKAGVFKEVCNLAKSYGFNAVVGAEFGRGYRLEKINSSILEIRKPNGNLIHLSLDLANFLLQKVVQGIITIEDISQKKAIEKLEENNPLIEPFILNGYCTVWANLIQLILDLRNNNASDQPPYVLIVDEINRGNISRIFGELITLIEDSKRQGAEEELSVTLPYSKEEFSVPSNLYIIGTMNSSDRSLTGLDIALRRRFTFIEMPPKPELLNDVVVDALNIAEVLKVINQRIEVLLDRDHCLGHANFMSLKKLPTREHLAEIFKQKIIPQLQEYFFDDWSKIKMVLNANGMLRSKGVDQTALFPNVSRDAEPYFEEKIIWEIDDTAFESIESFKKIIRH